MEYNEEVFWVNQSLHSYYDGMYESKGYLELSISISTKDNFNFSFPRFSISTTNDGRRRVCNLNYADVLDLLETFNKLGPIINDIYENPQSGDITRRYNKSRDLTFEFRKADNGQRVVVVRIVFGNSDEGKVIIPLMPEFITIGKILRVFQENYALFMTNLPNRYLLSNILTSNKSIETAIKILPTQIEIPQIQQQELHIEQPEIDIEKLKEINEFEKFVEDTVDDVRIPELESKVVDPKEPITQEYESHFIDNVLKGDIRVFKQLIEASIASSDPYSVITENFAPWTELTPGIEEDEMKSIRYISNFFFKINYLMYVEQKTAALPLKVPMTIYNSNTCQAANYELACDLIMINAYLKSYRHSRESQSDDAHENGALIHFAARCYLDVLAYSFFDIDNLEVTKNNVIARYKYFKEKGLFKYYDDLIIDNKAVEITINDIVGVIDNTFEALKTQKFINESHKTLYKAKTIILPPENEFNLEQINDIVDIEVKLKIGRDLESLTGKPEYIKLFKGESNGKPVKTNHKTEKKNKESNVLRWSKLNKETLPDSIRDEFIKHIEEMGDLDYNFFDDNMFIDELSDSIIKGLYIWNENKKLKYSDYCTRIEECMDKDLILAKIRETKNVDETEPEGNFLEDLNMDFG